MSAGEAFTNCEVQWRAVMLAVAGHLRHFEAGHLDAEDLQPQSPSAFTIGEHA